MTTMRCREEEIRGFILGGEKNDLPCLYRIGVFSRPCVCNYEQDALGNVKKIVVVPLTTGWIK